MALLLMAGFYLMALGISGALVWVRYAEWTYLGRVHFKIAAMCLGAAGAVLWSVMPRADRFEPPGPQLTPANAPRTFRIIHEVARATAQESPSEVYLLNEVNAWVTHRGGVMGLWQPSRDGRRPAAAGPPLGGRVEGGHRARVRSLRIRRREPPVWIHKTRSAIGRAVAATHDTFLEKPFQAYGRLFLKTTLTVSREQEFVADRTAAQVAGTMSAVSALRRVVRSGPAYSVHSTAKCCRCCGPDSCRQSPAASRAIWQLLEQPSTSTGSSTSRRPTPARVNSTAIRRWPIGSRP